METLDGLRDEAERLGLYFEGADLQRVASLLAAARASVRALGTLSTEWIEPSYVFTPTDAAPREADPPA